MKQCVKCQENLPFSSFSPASGAKYLRAECKKCNNKLSRERAAHRKMYGNPPEGYLCPICQRPKEELHGKGGLAGIWVVDHDHITNKFRGHLCHSCNRGLGIFGDSIERLERAIEYLKAV